MNNRTTTTIDPNTNNNNNRTMEPNINNRIIDPKTGRNISYNMHKVEYWSGWPEPCPYNDDLNWACGLAIKYMMSIVPKLKEAKKTGYLVLDIDDTILTNDPEKIIGITDMILGEKDGQLIFIAPVLDQVVTVAKKARELGLKIIILTSRPLESKHASVVNLNMFKVPYDKIIMNVNNEDSFFKVKIRKSLEKSDATVVLTIGDQPFDCYMPGNAAFIKVPDASCKASYAFFP